MAERAPRHLRPRLRRRPLVGAMLCVGIAAFFAAASVASAATVEGTDSSSGWTNPNPTITTAESLTFKNSSTLTPHGVAFDAPPAAPNCTGVVGSPGQTNWQGSCTFSQAGSYPFHCTVHPLAMKGTVTVNSTGPPPPTVTTGTGTPTSTTEATLQGSVNPNGVDTKYFFKYGTTETYGQSTSKEDVGSGSTSVPASANLTGLTPGTTYHFRLFAESTSGTSSGVDHTFKTLAPPTTVIDTKPAQITKLQTADFTFHSSPAGATEFDCKLDSGSFEACDSGEVSYAGPLSEGNHIFEVKATDANGTGPVATWAWMVDLTGPTTTILNPKPPTPNPGTSLTFKFSSSEAGSTFECSLEGPSQAHAFTTCSSSTGKTYSNLTSGSYTFKVRSTDVASNQGSAAAYAFMVDTSLKDTTPPDTMILAKPPDPSSSTSADFTYSSTEAGSTFECRMDGEGFSLCPATGKSYAGLSVGSHTFQVRATDMENNTDLTPAGYSFSVVLPTNPEIKPPEVTPPPKTAPDTRLTSKPKAKSRDKTPTFKFSATVSGATFECQLDGKAFKACRSPLTTKPLKPGKHSFKVRAVGPSKLKDPSPAAYSFKVLKP